MFLRLQASLLVAGALALPAWAQKAPRVPPPARAAQQAQKQAAAKQKQVKQKQVKAKQLNQLERLRRLTPQQRERVLENVPPARRQQIEERLDQYEKLPPEERTRLLRMANQLTPAERQSLRNLTPRFNALPDDRKPPVRQELNRLRLMTPEQRQTRIESDDFKKRFSPEEQDLLTNMSEALQQVE